MKHLIFHQVPLATFFSDPKYTYTKFIFGAIFWIL